MGAALLRAVKKDDHGFEIVAGVDPFMKESVPFPVFSSAEEINIPVDVVIDFSVPKATEEILAFCLKQRIPAVICTTALSDAEVNARLIDQDSNEMNIIVGVEQRDFERAVEAIYRAFA